MTHILVTGSSGFIGKVLCQRLQTTDYKLTQVIRSSTNNVRSSTVKLPALIKIPDINTDWDSILNGVDIIAHLAARVHVMDDTAINPLHAFRETNTQGTITLAKSAARSGVKRFIFLSTIKVNGESTTHKPFDESMPVAPQDPYAQSKYEAEQGLLKIAAESSMEVVIIRPPLIYGPEVKANFLRLLSWIDRGIPLPLAGIRNQRSLVAVDNLVDFLITCLDHPNAANETFLISDGEDLSTTELAQCIAKHMRHPAKLFLFPHSLMKLGASLLGKKAVVDRLTNSLQIDSSKAQQLLQWQPPLSMDDAMAKTVNWHLQQKTP